MKKYVKPETTKVVLDESICASDCITVKDYFNNSGKPSGKNFSFIIQCGNGGYDVQNQNLHAEVFIEKGEEVRINAKYSDKDWVTCNAVGWAKGCELQMPSGGITGYTGNRWSPSGKACYDKKDLVQVLRGGKWVNVPITWYGPTSTSGNHNWQIYNGN